MIRGQIYVYRMVDGSFMALMLENQHHYREWSGCFSAI